MAKAPVPGRVKTRLCPPCSPDEAAALAAAALADTLAAVVACGADRRILALDGEPGPWLPSGFELVAQRGSGFDHRLEAAWADAGGPGFQIGMDTPQLSGPDLDAALEMLERRRTAPAGPGAVTVDVAVLGPACDGGWWGLGVSRPRAGMFAGVPMSTSGTGAAQRARLEQLGMDVTLLAQHRDIDTVADLVAVAATMPCGRTPAVVASLDLDSRLTVDGPR